MLIDNPDALKEWLTAILEPMCDADPNALAKYVIALVKKDKPMSELRDTCLDQLDVFLQHETKPFVELLFKALDDKSYLVKSGLLAVPTQQPGPPGIDVTSGGFVNANSAVAIITTTTTTTTTNSSSSGTNNIALDGNRTMSPTAGTVPPTQVSPATMVTKGGGGPIGLFTSGSKVSERRLCRPESSAVDGDERDMKRRKPVGNRSRSRSRSPSWNRNRSRSRSRDRDDRRLRRGYLDDDRRRRLIGRRYDRYNDYRVPDRNRERVDRKRSRTRSRSPKSRSRSRSVSPNRNKDRDRQRVDGASKTHSPHSQDHGDKDYRFGASVAPVVSQPSASQQATSPANSRGPATGAVAASAAVVVGLVDTQAAQRNARRCRDYDEKGYCMRGDLCPFDHGTDPVVVEEVHLPNVLAYGPVGGAGGPPGPGPVQPPMPRPPVPPGAIPPLLGHPMVHPRPVPPPPPLHPLPGPRHFPHMPDPYMPEPYNPEAPGLDRMPPRLRHPFWGPRMGPGHRGPRPPMPFMHAARELINVPTVDNSNISDNPSMNNRTVMPPQQKPHNDVVGDMPHQQRIFRNMGGNNMDPMGKRRQFDYNRLGARNKFKLDNAVLELRKIPHGLNSIAQLNNHFSRFGRIVNLQVCYEGDPEGALVQFSSHAEAHAAYRSTEAVLNNRFIKVFWHNKDAPLAAALTTTTTMTTTAPVQESGSQPVKKSAKERLGLPVVGQNQVGDSNATTPTADETEKSSVILATSGALSKTVFNPAALKKSNFVANSVQQSNSAKVKEECFNAHEKIKKKQEEQRKEAFKIKADLMKREQELYGKQLQQQKLLIEKLEKNKGMTATERTSIMTTIKVLQESIERLKIGLEAASVSSHPKTKQEAQKEILDIEMELYNRQHSGADTSELRRKVAELKQEAISMGLIDRIPLRGGRTVLRKVIKGIRGGFRGRGRRGGIGIVRSVDHRPRKLRVIGFNEEDRDDVITHLAQYGEIENVGPEDDHLKLCVTFKTRREAELAVVKGAKYKDRILSMEWQGNASRRSSLAGDASADGLQDGLGMEDELFNPDEDLLLGDDEEEEDSEARSWRR